MVHYAVLANPGHNRVYFEQSGGLSLAELEVALGRFSTPCGEIGSKTMESRRMSGVYFAGEVLDVDAYTGGFNLQIAFSTGRAAGIAAALALKDR